MSARQCVDCVMKCYNDKMIIRIVTKDMKLPLKLTAQPKDVALSIENAIQKKQNIVYVKSVWRFIMLIIKNIPESIFKLMKL